MPKRNLPTDICPKTFALGLLLQVILLNRTFAQYKFTNSKLTIFYCKTHANGILLFYIIKKPILVKKLKKRTIKKVPGGNFGINISQMEVV